ncbi:MAG: glycosyltransferase [Mycobacterium sp.]
MATILAYTSPALGHLYPICALLSELHRRGHRIALRTLAAGVSTGRQLGFVTEAIDPRIEDIVMSDWTAPNNRAALKLSCDIFSQRAAHEIGDLRRSIEVVRPEAVIVDANCWGAAAVADAGELPWCSFWPFTPFLRSRGAPPFGPGLRPWPGVAGGLRDAALRPIVLGVVEKAMLGPLNTVRAEAGAAPVRSADEFARRAPLILVATGEPFEYPHPDWGDSVQMIGPCDFDPPAGDPPDWLGDIERPIVLVTVSSERQDDIGLGLTAMEALADQPVHVVVTLPLGVPAGVTPPPNATVKTFVPHGAVLDRAVCTVTHGGMGSTQKALARGVPVCVVPHGRDQFEVARRVEVSGSGTRLPAKKLTPARLKCKVLQAMSMADRAQRVAEGFAATGGVSRGADLVERRLLGQPANRDVEPAATDDR